MQPAILEPAVTARPPLFVFPDLADLRPWSEDVTPALADPPPPPDLVFGETDLARVVAAVRLEASQAARAAADASVEAAMRTATAALTCRFDGALAERREDTARIQRAVRHLFALFARGCLDAVAGTRLCEAMAQAVDHTLADLPAETEVTIEVAADLAPRMRVLIEGVTSAMPTLRANVLGRADLPPGDVLLSWQDSWAEWSFERLRRTFTARLGLDQGTPAAASLDPAATLPGPADQPPAAIDLPE